MYVYIYIYICEVAAPKHQCWIVSSPVEWYQVKWDWMFLCLVDGFLTRVFLSFQGYHIPSKVFEFRFSDTLQRNLTPMKNWIFLRILISIFLYLEQLLPLFGHPIKGCLVFSELPCICIWVLDIMNCNNIIYFANYLILTNVSVTESTVFECTVTYTHPIRFRTVLG